MIRRMTYGIAKTMSALVMVGVAAATQAQVRDDFPTCYGVLGDEFLSKSAQRELFVIVDQTISYDLPMKKHVHAKVHSFMRPGDRITLLTFSAYAKGRYDQMTLTGQLDQELTDDERFDVNKTKLRKFDACMTKQRVFAKQKIDSNLKIALENGTDDLPKTELLGALGNFSGSVFRAAPAGERFVLLVSDMLENSEQLSFYKSGGVRSLDPDSTLEKVREVGLLANFKGAHVNVIGAGITSSDAYISAGTMNLIRTFWEGYFEASEARLTGWGQPQLFTPIQ